MEEGLARVGQGREGDGLQLVSRMSVLPLPLPLLRLSESVRLTHTRSSSDFLTSETAGGAV